MTATAGSKGKADLTETRQPFCEAIWSGVTPLGVFRLLPFSWPRQVRLHEYNSNNSTANPCHLQKGSVPTRGHQLHD